MEDLPLPVRFTNWGGASGRKLDPLASSCCAKLCDEREGILSHDLPQPGANNSRLYSSRHRLKILQNQQYITSRLVE